MAVASLNALNRLGLRPQASARSAEPETPVSTLLMDYEFLNLAGRGTFSEVWQVREKPTQRILALKQLTPEWAEQKSARQLLANEAEVGSQIRSPYVIRVLGSRMDLSPRFTLLEWLEGTTLEKLLEQQPQLAESRAIWIARQCAEGLRDLQNAGYSHGDLKPANILILPNGTLKLIDLGFARPITTIATSRGPQRAAITGTPEFLAPEVLAGGAQDSLAKDAYSLGILMYRILAGQLPFQGETLPDILRQQQRAIAQPLRTSAPHVSRATTEFVERLLAKQPLRRKANWTDIVRELISLEIAAL